MVIAAAQQQPVVSVVLPMRNAAHTIDECLQSVAGQTYPHFEVVLIDDGSTDNSLDLARRRCAQDRRFHLHQQPPLGLVPALNKGLQLARGRYVARMDADDVMFENRLQAQVDFLTRHSSVDLVATQVELFPKHQVTAGYQEYIRWQNHCLQKQGLSIMNPCTSEHFHL